MRSYLISHTRCLCSCCSILVLCLVFRRSLFVLFPFGHCSVCRFLITPLKCSNVFSKLHVMWNVCVLSATFSNIAVISCLSLHFQKKKHIPAAGVWQTLQYNLLFCWNYTRNCNLHVHQIQQPCEHRPFRTEWNVLFLQSESDWSLHRISSKLWDVSWKKSNISNDKGYNIMDDQGSGVG
jgi:hypothetical protein